MPLRVNCSLCLEHSSPQSLHGQCLLLFRSCPITLSGLNVCVALSLIWNYVDPLCVFWLIASAQFSVEWMKECKNEWIHIPNFVFLPLCVSPFSNSTVNPQYRFLLRIATSWSMITELFRICKILLHPHSSPAKQELLRPLHKWENRVL